MKEKGDIRAKCKKNYSEGQVVDINGVKLKIVAISEFYEKPTCENVPCAIQKVLEEASQPDNLGSDWGVGLTYLRTLNCACSYWDRRIVVKKVG